MMTLKQAIYSLILYRLHRLARAKPKSRLAAASACHASAVQVSNKIPAVSNSSKVGYKKQVIWVFSDLTKD